MTYEEFQAQVDKLELTVETIAKHKGNISIFPNTDYSIDVCECVAFLTGFDETWVKMFNRQFREDAAKVCFEIARRKVAA